MPIGPARMPLMDHLGELRRRLTIIVVSLVITAIVQVFWVWLAVVGCGVSFSGSRLLLPRSRARRAG